MNTRLTGIAGGITAVGVLAVAFIGIWEGLRLSAYRDVIGVVTICYGETKGIRMGMRFTKPECDELFIHSLKGYETSMRRCLKAPDVIPDKAYVSFLSLTYNIGGGCPTCKKGFCTSSVVKRWNVGDRYGACNALMLYNKAGGRTVRGLTNRRKAERKMCMEGLSEPVTLLNPNDVAVKDRPILRRGERGRWVEHLQKQLGIVADSQFGPDTHAAVLQFQKKWSLKEDGVVGPLTWTLIERGEKR